MSALLLIYGPSIAAAAVIAAGLAAIGAHTANRNQAMQTLCLSQGALFGVLLGIGLSHAGALSAFWSGTLPLITGNLCAGLTVFAAQALAREHPASKGTILVAVFALLLAVSHLAGALFPGLESHMSQRYFGDLATMTDGSAHVLLALGGLLLIYLKRAKTRLLRTSFDHALTGDSDPTRPSPPYGVPDTFTWTTMIVVAVCVQLTGLLFTVLCLFLPTSIMALSKRASAAAHIRSAMVTASVGSAGGFFMALIGSHLPTVPTIAVVMLAVGSALVFATNKATTQRG